MKTNFKFFIPLAMFYTAVALADLVLVYRLTSLGTLTITSGIYVMPIYYMLEDMIAELYGYERVRQVIWSVQISALIFSTIVTLASFLPAPESWQHTDAYALVFGHVFRTILGGGLVAMLGGAFVNGYMLSKWKILAKGKHFFIRSVGSSAVGQLFQTAAGCILLYFDILPFETILSMIIPLYCIQLVGCFLVTIPGSMMVTILKKLEGVDIYDHNINFNPFRFSVSNKESTIQIA